MAGSVNDENAAAEARAMPLRLPEKIGYAFGGLVDGTSLQAIHVFLMFYLTAVCGVPGGIAGTAIAAGLIVDAIADPLIGSRSDALRSRFGRRLPFMIAAVPLVALSTVMFFGLPAGMKSVGMFVWLALSSMAFRISVSLFLLPHQALGAELSDDYHERSTIMMLRWSMYMIGGILAVVLGFGLFFKGDAGLSQRHNYLPFAMLLAVIIAIGGLISCLSALGTRAREHMPAHGYVPARFLLKEIVEVFRNRSFRLLFLAYGCFFIGFGINNTLTLHANTYFWHLEPTMTRSVMMALFLGLLLGAPMAQPLLARMEKRTVIMVGITGLLCAQALPATLRLLGLLRWEGQPLATALSLVALVMGIMTGLSSIASASALADAADEHEHLFGTRREGLYFAALSFISKGATAVAALVSGLALEVLRIRAGSAPTGSTDLLGLIYGPGAALLSFGAVLTMAQYRIDRQALARIRAALDARHIK